MKKFISILFCLFMFPLFINTSSADTSPPDQSDDPRNIMNSESVDFNKETLQLHKRIAELEGLLSEANAKISDLEGKLEKAVSDTVYDDAVRLLKEANAKISDLEGELAKADVLYDDAVRLNKEQKAQLEADRITIEEHKQGKNELSSLLEASRAKHLAAEQQLATAQTRILDLENKIIKTGDELVEKHAKIDEQTNQLATAQTRILGLENIILKWQKNSQEKLAKIDEQTNQLETNRKEAEEQQNRITTISSELNSCTSQIDICTAAKERRGVEFSDSLITLKTKHTSETSAQLKRHTAAITQLNKKHYDHIQRWFMVPPRPDTYRQGEGGATRILRQGAKCYFDGGCICRPQ